MVRDILNTCIDLSRCGGCLQDVPVGALRGKLFNSLLLLLVRQKSNAALLHCQLMLLLAVATCFRAPYVPHLVLPYYAFPRIPYKASHPKCYPFVGLPKQLSPLLLRHCPKQNILICNAFFLFVLRWQHLRIMQHVGVRQRPRKTVNHENVTAPPLLVLAPKPEKRSRC